MPYAINSGENLLLKFGLIDLPAGVTWRGIYDPTATYVVNDAVLGADNNGYKNILGYGPPPPDHPPPNATYWLVLSSIPAANVVNCLVELVDSSGKTQVTYAYTRGAPQTSGLLQVGKVYIITTFVTGDDFTNCGAASNASGVVFIATNTTPTTWTHASVLQAMSVPPNMTITDGLLALEVLAGDTRPLNGTYELRVTISWFDNIYIQSSAQTDVLCLPEAIEITPC